MKERARKMNQHRQNVKETSAIIQEIAEAHKSYIEIHNQGFQCTPKEEAQETIIKLFSLMYSEAGKWIDLKSEAISEENNET